jgi:predicted small metal-binding protein
MAAEDDEEILRDLEKHGKFYHTFNEWLQWERRK